MTLPPMPGPPPDAATYWWYAVFGPACSMECPVWSGGDGAARFEASSLAPDARSEFGSITIRPMLGPWGWNEEHKIGVCFNGAPPPTDDGVVTRYWIAKARADAKEEAS